VLRGLLLTGGQPEFMRAEVSGGEDHPPAASTHALWWPPSKIAGRWLAPYLAQRHEELEQEPNGLAVETEVSPSARRRAVIGVGQAHKPRLVPINSTTNDG
jgi:hypothetical protein